MDYTVYIWAFFLILYFVGIFIYGFIKFLYTYLRILYTFRNFRGRGLLVYFILQIFISFSYAVIALVIATLVHCPDTTDNKTGI